MGTIGKLSIGVASAAAASMLLAATASACSCAPPDVRTFKGADDAIIGKLLRVDDVPQPGGPGPVGPGEADYIYRVTRSFKRPARIEAGDRVRVRSSSDGASCGIEQPVGSRRGLFLYRDKGRWTSNLCAMTTRGEMRRLAREARSGDRRERSAPGGCSASSI